MTTCSCRFMLHNIRRPWPLLTQKATQVLVHALVIFDPDYRDLILAGLPACAICRLPLRLLRTGLQPTQDLLHHTTRRSALATDSCSNPKSNLNRSHWYFSTMLQMAPSQPWSDHTSQPVHYCTPQPVHYRTPSRSTTIPPSQKNTKTL